LVISLMFLREMVVLTLNGYYFDSAMANTELICS
jgi:hypothetical protein